MSKYRYEAEECKCGHGQPPVDRTGPYRGLCAAGKYEALEKRRERKEERKKQVIAQGEAPVKKEADPLAAEIKKNKDNKNNLSKAAKQLVKSAEKFEASIEKRDDARMAARYALKDFNDDLQMVSRVARAMLEGHKIMSDGEDSGDN